jgi:hypothetical protein
MNRQAQHDNIISSGDDANIEDTDVGQGSGDDIIAVEMEMIPILEMDEQIYSSVGKDKKIQSQTLIQLKEI